MDAIPVPHNDPWILWMAVLLLGFAVIFLIALAAFAWCMYQQLAAILTHINGIHRKLSSSVEKIENLEKHRARHAYTGAGRDVSDNPPVESPAPITRPGPVVSPDGPPTVSFISVPQDPAVPPIRNFRP
jgi:hypothetical protein